MPRFRKPSLINIKITQRKSEELLSLVTWIVIHTVKIKLCYNSRKHSETNGDILTEIWVTTENGFSRTDMEIWGKELVKQIKSGERGEKTRKILRPHYKCIEP